MWCGSQERKRLVKALKAAKRPTKVRKATKRRQELLAKRLRTHKKH